MCPLYISDILTCTDLLSWPRLYQISLQRGPAEQDCEFSLLTNTANTRSHTPPTVPEVSTPSATQTWLSWRTCHQVFLSMLWMGLMVEISVYAQQQIRSLTWWVTPGLIRGARLARWVRTRGRHTRAGLNIAAALAVIFTLHRSLETYCSKYKDVECCRGFAWSKQTAWLKTDGIYGF